MSELTDIKNKLDADIKAHQSQVYSEWQLMFSTLNLMAIWVDKRFNEDLVITTEKKLSEVERIYNNFRKEWERCQNT